MTPIRDRGNKNNFMQEYAVQLSRSIPIKIMTDYYIHVEHGRTSEDGSLRSVCHVCCLGLHAWLGLL